MSRLNVDFDSSRGISTRASQEDLRKIPSALTHRITQMCTYSRKRYAHARRRLLAPPGRPSTHAGAASRPSVAPLGRPGPAELAPDPRRPLGHALLPSPPTPPSAMRRGEGRLRAKAPAQKLKAATHLWFTTSKPDTLTGARVKLGTSWWWAAAVPLRLDCWVGRCMGAGLRLPNTISLKMRAHALRGLLKSS